MNIVAKFGLFSNERLSGKEQGRHFASINIDVYIFLVGSSLNIPYVAVCTLRRRC